jgi:hypothetical protein
MHCRGCAHITVLIRSCRLNTLSRSEPERLDIRTGDSDKTHSHGTLRGEIDSIDIFLVRPIRPKHTSRVTNRETAEHGEDAAMPRRLPG